MLRQKVAFSSFISDRYKHRRSDVVTKIVFVIVMNIVYGIRGVVFF